jgi:hypothetical protein
MKIHDCSAKIYSIDSVFGTAWFRIVLKLSNASAASKYAPKKSAFFENKR